MKNLHTSLQQFLLLIGLLFLSNHLLSQSNQTFNVTYPHPDNGYILYEYGYANYSTFLWSNGATTRHVFNLSPGTYYVTATDASSNSTIDTFDIGTCYSDYQFTWANVPTLSSHTIHIPGSPNVLVNGIDPALGDQIGVFYDSLGHWACGGFITWTGLPQTLTAYGDPLGNSGFETGEEFRFLIRSTVYGIDYRPEAICNLSGTFSDSINFTPSGNSGITNLTTNNSVLHSMKLTKGQSKFSLPIEPLIPDFADAFLSPVGSQTALELIVSDAGALFWGFLGANNIGAFTSNTFYTAKMNWDQVYEIEGFMVDSVNSTVLQNICFNAPNGYIDLKPSFGIPPYTYIWSTGETGNPKLNAVHGETYTVTITDSQSTQVVRSYVPEGIDNIPDYNFTYTIPQQGLSNGGIVVEISGFKPTPISRQWSTGSSSASLTNIPAGIYALSVQNGYGCATDTSVELVSTNFVVDITTTNADSSLNNGHAHAIAYGGVAPYSFSWSTGGTGSNAGSLAPGIYQLTVTDNAGAMDIVDLEILQVFQLDWTNTFPPNDHVISIPDDVSFNINYLGEFDYSDKIGAFYNTGSGLACAGQATFAMLVGNQMMSVCRDDMSTTIIDGYQIGQTFQWYMLDVSKGDSYQLYAEYDPTFPDEHFFDTSGYSRITQFSSTNFGKMYTSVAIGNTCYQTNNGQAWVENVQGLPPFVYAYSTGQTTDSISGLVAGDYYITVSDARNHIVIDTIIITQPDSFQVDTAYIEHIDPAIGQNGSIEVVSEGGTEPYTFQWTFNLSNTTPYMWQLDATTYSCTATDANGCWYTDTFVVGYTYPPLPLVVSTVVTNVDCSGGTNGAIDLSHTGGSALFWVYWSNGLTNVEDLTGLSAGNYTATVYSAYDPPYIITSTVLEPDPFAIDTVITPVDPGLGNNGAIDLSVTGGTLPYFYVWSNGGLTEDIANLVVGTYTVTINDSNGCSTSATITVDYSVPIVPISVNASIVDLLCFGICTGEIDITALGGISPFSFTWSDGSATEDLSGLCSGAYFVTITDALNSTFVWDTILVEPSELAIDTVVTHIDPALGNTGAIDVTVSGGTQPYTFLWSTAEVSEDVLNLAIGTYTFTVTDANNCSSTISIDINYTYTPLPLSITNTTVNPLCFGDCTGTIDIEATGGVVPYTYIWSNGSLTEDLTGLCATTYFVTVTDAANSSSTWSVEIIEPDEITISLSGTNVNPSTGTGGTVTATVSGGTPTYSYAWSDGSLSSQITNASYGNYQLTLTDANGCIATCEYFVDFSILPPWNVNFSTTGHTIEIPSTANLQINGSTLQPNDFIGVFYDSLGTLACGGYAVWNGNSTSVIAHSKDISTTLDDGFVANEQFTWKFWDASANTEHNAVAFYDSTYSHQEFFATNGLSAIDSLLTVSISGTVSTQTKSNLPLGMVVLYQEINGNIMAINNGLIIDGNYEIDGLYPGSYLAYAIPQSGNNYGIPAYFVSRDQWQEATAINVVGHTGNVNISLEPSVPYQSGSGNISGNVTVGNDPGYNPDVFDFDWFPASTKQYGDAARNIPVILYDQDYNPINFMLTDENGHFGFEQMALGQYYVRVEKAGLVSDSVEVLLTQTNLEGVVDFELNQGQVTVAVDEIRKGDFKIFPNPVDDILSVVFNCNSIRDYSISLFSIDGKQIELDGLNQTLNSLINIDMKGIKPGIYLLKINSKSEAHVFKIVKK
ncbi:MAG: T9SS type A sorting domain-containing protein [Bacteroidales bacterium]|nr:T9SS type A sorting domain-containing protein [Bacteroidales bacterium]MCF8457588.1 T9SS type A sorting domain-containing protein [Bacteroidales bacterium]